MKKNGFVSTSIIYTFFVIFLLLMMFLLNNYSRIRFLLDEYKYDIKNSFALESLADINLFFMVYNEMHGDYELVDNLPLIGYTYNEEFSYCKNGSEIIYNNGNISIASSRRDSCYAYFTKNESDVKLNVYVKESNVIEPILVKKIPDNSYNLISATCTNGGTITFDDLARKFTIDSEKKTECEAVFAKKKSDITINIYKESASGDKVFENEKYALVDNVPGTGYTFYKYECLGDTVLEIINGEIHVNASEKDECNVYFKGGDETVELIYMVETDTGVTGFTTGKLYSQVYSVPASGYIYVGTLCDNLEAQNTAKYENGKVTVESSVQTTCRAYFNRASVDVTINYHLENSDGTYESVVEVPSVGYIYNEGLSKCKFGSTIVPRNNRVSVSASVSNEVCDIYYDQANADIKVLVYVMDRQNNKFQLSDVPTIGYEMFNPSCTNGAYIEYRNGLLEVASEGPTVCTVYFR